MLSRVFVLIGLLVSTLNAETKATFRLQSPELSDSAFEAKWAAAMQSPFALFRAFPRQFHIDQFSNSADIAPCFGDAHWQNFGFLRFSSKTRFVFNDLDDSALCTPYGDLLRFFVSLQLDPQTVPLTDELMQWYRARLESHVPAVELAESEIPDLSKKLKKNLKEYTNGRNSFLAHPELRALPTDQKKSLERVLEEALPDRRILDLAVYLGADGASIGLLRYWLLIGPNLEILELKQLVTSAPEFAGYPLVDKRDRIDWAARELWDEQTLTPTRSLPLPKGSFLLRSRTKKSPDWEKMNSDTLLRYLKASLSSVDEFQHKFFSPEQLLKLTQNLEKDSAAVSKHWIKLWRMLHDRHAALTGRRATFPGRRPFFP